MVSEWPLVRLEELASDQAGAIAIGPFGSRLKSDVYTNCGVALIRGMNLSRSRFLSGDFVYISEDTARGLGNANVKPWDLVFPHRGNVGTVGLVPDSLQPYALSTSLMKMTVNRHKVDPTFLYYFFRSSQGQAELLKNASQVGTPGIATPLTSLKACVVPIPPLGEQIAAAGFLSLLDDRINLLKQTNATLESIAQALFKSWFIDFDPVRAKAEGREPEGMDSATATLFPAEFEESSLGLIPKGWRAETLAAICTNPRAQAKPDQISPDTTYIGLEHMPRKSIALDAAGTAEGLESAKFWFERGDVLFGKLRPYFHKVGLAPCRGVCSTDILVLRPKTAEWLGFLAMHASSDALISHTTQLSNGARMPRTSWHDVGGYNVVLPSKNVTTAFNAMIGPMFARIHVNIEAARMLAELRNLLLPRLISGKLRLPEAQTQLEEANA